MPQKTQQNLILSFLAPLYRLALAKVMLDKLPWESDAEKTLLLPSPITDITPRSSASERFLPPPVEQVCDRRHNKWHRTGRLLARAGYVSPCSKSCVYGICAFVLRCFFSVLTLYSPMEHSLGVTFFFPPLFPHVNAVFFLHSLSSCSVYPIVICMLCMYGQVDG